MTGALIVLVLCTATITRAKTIGDDFVLPKSFLEARDKVLDLIGSGNLSEARDRSKRLVQETIFNYGKWGLEAAFSLQLEAKIYTQEGEYRKSIDILEEVLKVLISRLGSEHAETARVLNSIALNHLQDGSYDKALLYQNKALQIRETIYGKDHLDTITYLNDLAAIHVFMGQYENALPIQFRVLEARENLLPRNHPHIAHIMINIAHTYSELDNFSQAILFQRRALNIYKETLGSESLAVARAYNNIAQTHANLAEFDIALEMQSVALERYEKIFGPKHPETAAILNNMSSILMELLQNDKAMSYQLRALEIRMAMLGDRHPDTIASQNNLAKIYSTIGENEAEIELRFKVLAATEDIFGKSHPRLGQAQSNLGVALGNAGRHREALTLHIQAIELYESRFGYTSNKLIQPLLYAGISHYYIRDFEKSLAYLRRALAICLNNLGSSHPSTAEASHTLGDLFRLTGDLSSALPLYKVSVNAYQAIRERISKIGDAELHGYTTGVASVYQKLASVLTDQGRLAEAQMVLDMLKEDEQFDFIRRSAGADPRRTRIGYTPTEERWMSRYREIADRLAALGREEQALQKQAKLGLSEEQKKRQAALAADLKVAQAAFESFLEQMRQEFAAKGPARSVEFAESSVKALAELQDLLKGLGDDVALLRIYLTDEQVNFLLTTPGVQLARNVKIKTQDLNRQVAELNRLLRDPKSDPLPAAQALYKLLLAPVEQDLQQAGAKTVMLSLDGVLRYLPFGVLHDGQRYAMQRWNLPVYTSVVRERLRDAANANWQAAGLGVTRKHGNFDPLPAVRTEMSSIVRTGTTGVLPGEVHLDEAFTAQRLKDVSQRRFPVVHVASHFQFSPGTEVNSFLLLGDGTQLTLGDIRTQNYRFDDVDLLTLSACETGLGGGRDQRGREIEGFGVIAQQQGAKAVLATLWKVADSSTATLMGDMYRRRTQAGLSKIEALRQAQVALAAQPRTAHPFYWAPFVLMGNWK